MTVHLDTLTKNVCDAKSFQIPVWVGDLYFKDSIYGFTMIVYWDRSKFDLETILGISSETIVHRNATTVTQVDKDPELGILYIQVADTSFRSFIAGQGKPLLNLVGKVTAPDTVTGADGWIQVNRVVFESATTFDPITYEAGLVHVVRDTTPAYTGRMSVTGDSFDTLRTDTVTLTVENLKGRRVNEVAFSLAAEGTYYSFLDTLQGGTLAEASGWQLKDVSISPDTIKGRFVSETDLAADGPLLKIVLRRETDSAFDSALRITDFQVNASSCLGRVSREDARITATAIVADSSSSVVPTNRQRQQTVQVRAGGSDGALVIVAEGVDIQSATLYDGAGRMVAADGVARIGAASYRFEAGMELPSGNYFLVLRGRQEIVYKQFSLIK